MGQMIVTCDHCGTRYKLDNAKIPGRGARVTCPGCKHVFVVYRQEETTEQVTASEPSGPSVEEEIAGLDPDNLDFRSVGISSWKVKVKIGLVYDFNDFKTIDKYIREGRVSGSDLLSHDGEQWRPIEEIPDLRHHFCEVYVHARRAQQAQGEGAAESTDPDATQIIRAPTAQAARPRTLSVPSTASAERFSMGGNDADIASAMADAVADVNSDTATGPRFVDPFEAKRNATSSSRGSSSSKSQRKESQRPSRRGAKESANKDNGSRGLIMIAAAMVIVVVGGLLYTLRPNTVSETADTVTSTAAPIADEQPVEEGSGDGEVRNIIDELELELLDRGEPVEEPADPNLDEWGTPIEQELIPVVPEEFRNAGGDDLNGGTFSAADKTAAEHATAGRNAAGIGDWRSAVRNYQQAVAMEPMNDRYVVELGRAQYRSGDNAAAVATLKRAENRGDIEAIRLLGDIAFDQGDRSGAMVHYQNYLRSNPPDRAQIERRIELISGG